MITETEIEDYLNDRRINNIHNSNNTTRTYRRILSDWAVFSQAYDFKNGRDKSEIQKASRDYLILCKQTRSAKQTLAELHVLANFYRYHGYAINPWPRMTKSFRVPRKETVTKRIQRDDRVMTESEVFKILNHARAACAGKTGIDRYLAWRNVIIVEMLSEYGMRVSGLVGIDIADIDFGRRACTVRESKNQEPYILPIKRKTGVIQQYLQIMTESGPAVSSDETGGIPFLQSKTGRRLSDTSARRAVNGIFDMLGFYDARRSTHQLRHFRATKYYKEGMRIDLIAKIMGLGVETLKKTYLHLTHDDTVAEYERWADNRPEVFVCPNCGYRKGQKIDRPVDSGGWPGLVLMVVVVPPVARLRRAGRVRAAKRSGA